MKIVWDEPKRALNKASHGLDFTLLTVDFFLGARIASAKKGRFQALGLLDGRAYSVIFKPLGSEAVSVISFRAASKAERRFL